MTGQVIVRRFVGGPLLTDCYAVIVPDLGAVLIDAPRDAWQAAIEAAETMNAPMLLAIATHGHWDHVTDMARVREAGIPLAAHQADAYMLSDPHGQGLNIPFVVDPVSIDRPLSEGDRVAIGPVELHILHTPGHTPGSVTVWLPREDVMFTGDTLLKGGAGHTAEPGASLPALATSVRRLAAFPESTTLYPGHGAPTTIGEERWLETLSDPDAPLVQWRPSNERRKQPHRTPEE
ncbi:MAG: MBL fold metallo-hydrolase [Chloroflexota bacterium]|nr:MBL fold metallo-hydrolase [Chloroflexota bacterium]